MRTSGPAIRVLGALGFVFVVLFPAAVASQVSLPAASAVPEVRSVQPPFFTAPPKIDGRLDDAC